MTTQLLIDQLFCTAGFFLAICNAGCKSKRIHTSVPRSHFTNSSFIPWLRPAYVVHERSQRPRHQSEPDVLFCVMPRKRSPQRSLSPMPDICHAHVSRMMPDIQQQPPQPGGAGSEFQAEEQKPSMEAVPAMHCLTRCTAEMQGLERNLMSTRALEAGPLNTMLAREGVVTTTKTRFCYHDKVQCYHGRKKALQQHVSCGLIPTSREIERNKKA